MLASWVCANSAIDEERSLEGLIILTKGIYLETLKCQAQAIVDGGDDPSGNPKRKRKSRRS
jgi:hypothetical protein